MYRRVTDFLVVLIKTHFLTERHTALHFNVQTFLKCCVLHHLKAMCGASLSTNHKDAPAAPTGRTPLNQFFVPQRDSFTLSCCLSQRNLHRAGLQLLSLGTCPDYCVGDVSLCFYSLKLNFLEVMRLCLPLAGFSSLHGPDPSQRATLPEGPNSKNPKCAEA